MRSDRFDTIASKPDDPIAPTGCNFDPTKTDRFDPTRIGRFDLTRINRFDPIQFDRFGSIWANLFHGDPIFTFRHDTDRFDRY